jgi:hypothetical protein
MLREKSIVVMSQVRRHVAVRTSSIARRAWEMDTAEREKITDPDILAMSENNRRAMQFSGGGGKGSSHQVSSDARPGQWCCALPKPDVLGKLLIGTGGMIFVGLRYW